MNYFYLTMSQLRRRQIENNDKGIIELPDYVKLVTITTSQNEELHLAYYALGVSNLIDLIVDGEHTTEYLTNGSDCYLTIPNPGTHTIYIKVKQPYSNKSYHIALKSRTYEYVRFPYTYISAIRLTDGVHIKTFEALNKLDLMANSYNTSWTIDELHVPVGTRDWYMAQKYNGAPLTTWYHAENIIEVDYKGVPSA